MTRTLPTFRGYTVDERLQEFRRWLPDRCLLTVPFDSPHGEQLLPDYQAKGGERAQDTNAGQHGHHTR